MEKLQEIEEQIFLFLNGFHSPFFDQLMSIVTNRLTWIPLYLLLIFIIWRTFSRNQAITSILFLFAAVGLADYITSGLMKPFFERLRPCYNPDLDGLVHVVNGCGGKFGFVSSHAANTFALFGGLFFIFKKNSLLLKLMFPWAIIVSYSRIYVGVHYFGDVFLGALIGFLIAYLCFKFLTFLKLKSGSK